jgi:hypothetical protein
VGGVGDVSSIGVTQGFEAPSFGESKSPEEVAPTPAPIGIVPAPPKPPDVLGQHSLGSTVLHPIAGTGTRRAMIEATTQRMG